MQLADLRRLGYLPLQHHEPGVDVDLRNVVYAARFKGLDPRGNRTMIEPGTMGDIVGQVAWENEPAKRNWLAAWSFAMPVVVSSVPTPGDGGSQLRTRTRPQLGAGDGPRFRPVKDRKWASDSRFVEKEIGEDHYPVGTRGLVVSAVNEEAQEELFIPGPVPLVAVNKAGQASLASLVHDLDDKSALDPTRRARLHSHLRVVKPLIGGCGGITPSPEGGSLAWQLAPAGRDGISGHGLVYDTPFANEEQEEKEGVQPGERKREATGDSAARGQEENRHGKVTGAEELARRFEDMRRASDAQRAKQLAEGTQTSGSVSFVGQTRLRNQEQTDSMLRGNGGGGDTEVPRGDKKTPAAGGIVASTTARKGGPLEVGSQECQHRLGDTADGEPINSNHISTRALYWKDKKKDGPVEFSEENYPQVLKLPFKTKVNLGWDQNTPHPWTCGDRQGKWRFWAESFFDTDDGKRDPPPHLPPPQDPPPFLPPDPPKEPPRGRYLIDYGRKYGVITTYPTPSDPNSVGNRLAAANQTVRLTNQSAGKTGQFLLRTHPTAPLLQDADEIRRQWSSAILGGRPPNQRLVSYPYVTQAWTGGPVSVPELVLYSDHNEYQNDDLSRAQTRFNFSDKLPQVASLQGFANQSDGGGFRRQTTASKPTVEGRNREVQGGVALLPTNYTINDAKAGVKVPCGREMRLTLPPISSKLSFATPTNRGTVKSGVTLYGNGISLKADLVNSNSVVTSIRDMLDERRIEGLQIRADATGSVIVTKGFVVAVNRPDIIEFAADTTIVYGYSVPAMETKPISPGTVATVNGNPLVTGTGTAFLTALAPGGVPRVLTGTIGTGGVPAFQITGVGTKFMTEVAVGDLVGPPAGPLTRVIKVLSDTLVDTVLSPSTTIANGSIGVVIENAVINVPLTSPNKRVSQVISNTSIQAESNYGITFGGLFGAVGDAIPNQWFSLWAIKRADGTTIMRFSTQRTKPFMAGLSSNPAISYSRVGWVLSKVGTDGLRRMQYYGDGEMRTAMFEEPDAALQSLVGGVAVAWTTASTTLFHPPTAQSLHVLADNNATPDTGTRDVILRPRGMPGTPRVTAEGSLRIASQGPAGTGGAGPQQVQCPCLGSMGLEYIFETGPAAGGLTLGIQGWDENVLGPPVTSQDTGVVSGSC